MPKTLLKELFSKIRGWVRRGLLGRGTATVHPVATWMSPQSPPVIFSALDYTNAENMLAATSFVPLLVNLESVTSKVQPNAGGGSKNCVAWKVEKAMHYIEHADKVTTDSSTDQGQEPQPLEGCLILDVAQPFYKLHHKLMNAFQRRGFPGENEEGYLYCIFRMRANKRFIQGEANTMGQGRSKSCQIS